ncbi:MAG: AAA family ATPase [Bacteroidia bacterium]|nr:AAA family ATPase [Bacteroidia bacterium]
MGKSLTDKFKFKEIRFYCSDEWMAGSTKKYRTVFERQEVRYIWAEFSFYNKLFDEEEWSAKITMKSFAFEGSDKRELCKLESDRIIKTDENIVYVREGWGNETAGMFWKKGDYCWEAYIGDSLVGTEKFHIEDVGMVSPGYNPYFEIESVKLFEAGYDYPKMDNRKYLKKFKRCDTRYVWVEFNIINKTNANYYCEIFYNFYDDAGQYKAQTSSLELIGSNKSGVKFTFDVGWGNKVSGSWKDDKYIIEMVFMDTLIAVVPFEVGEEAVEGITEPVKNITPEKIISTTNQSAPEKEQSLEEIMQEIEQLIGLEDVKKNIKTHIDYLNFIKLRKEKGFDDSEKINLHSVFTGNPGTGKTTVVRMMGKLYKNMGLLSKGHVIEAGRADLVSEYIGQTAPKVKDLIEKARGGILFIDEAYSLVRDKSDTKDFGREVIEILIKELSDGKGDLAVMVAGYPKEMQVFIDSNPGLKSRFNHYFHFDDYIPEELIKIVDFACNKRKVTLVPEAREYLMKIITDKYRDRDSSFGNGRFAYSLVDEAKINLGLRLMHRPDIKDLSNEVLSTIEMDDVKKIFESKQKKIADIAIDEPLLRISLEELNSLIGMVKLKEEINDLVKLIRYYREIGKDVLNKFSMHIVFTGNPGTGKTTVARIIGKIFKSLGMLERGHLTECDRESLVAGYIGQTAIKTNELIEQARNGVLFIDEAYSLMKESGNDFGSEAIEILLKRMEDLKGELSIIVAGYPDKMDLFLESNPGLKSRFNQHYCFEDYSPDELFDIALVMLQKENLKPDINAEIHLKKYFIAAFSARDKFFGNARFVRNTIGEVVKNQNLRMASLPAGSRTEEMIETVTIVDVQEFNFTQQNKPGKMGFKP